MSDIIVVIIFVASLVGLQNPIYGSISGLILSIAYCYFRPAINIYSWFLLPIVGAVLGLLLPIAIRWLFSGLRGSRGKTKPGVTYIGGFGIGRAGQFFGKWSEGIIPTENEETGWLANEEEKRERNVGVLIRYLSAPIVLILALIAFMLLT